ncbi:MAG: AAA family ATPase, partial [Myxococcales bacterium]|nr:AAA family ATPase [Myxococcales bacterium]
MSARTNVCRDCGFSNPRSWRTCARCTARLDATAAAPLPLIGHASAAEVIRASIDCAFSMGATTVVAIEGMNGSGKSRLLTHAGEFGARANDGMPLLHTTAGAGGTASPYDPFSTMLLERFGVLPNAPAAAVRGHMFTVVSECLSTSDAVTIAETTHLLGYIAGVEFPDSPFLMPLADRPLELRRRAAQAFRQFVEADVQRAPVLMLIDEAHRMEEPAWQLLRMLFDVEGHLAIVLAGNAPLADRTRTFGPANRTETCVIAPLAHDDVAAMLMVLLPTLESAPEPLVSALHHRSGGNPSVLRAMVLSLVEQGLFEDRDGALVANLAR